MTKREQAIILVSIIGTILDEYRDESEITPPVLLMKGACRNFMKKESGVKYVALIGHRIVDKKKHKTFASAIFIGDKIWRLALDRYIKESLTIEAVALIRAVYDFAPEILAKYAHISQKRIKDYGAESALGDDKFKMQGAVVGGFLVELLAKEMGIKTNGRLTALKNKVQREII